jgi:hypothetical protein
LISLSKITIAFKSMVSWRCEGLGVDVIKKIILCISQYYIVFKSVA